MLRQLVPYSHLLRWHFAEALSSKEDKLSARFTDAYHKATHETSSIQSLRITASIDITHCCVQERLYFGHLDEIVGLLEALQGSG